MKITIETIPHNQQRYATVGDWWFEGETLQVRVSQMGDEYKEMLVALHEVDEALSCRKRGILQEAVDVFDVAYEEARDKGVAFAPCLCVVQEEPGDDMHAPYYREHQEATAMERTRATFWNIDWNEYDKLVGSL